MFDLNKPLRVFTAFSGYDSQCLALDRLSQHFPDFKYELVGWSEIDENAIKAHNVLFPQYADRNYGDISKVDWNDVPDFDLLTYSSPCTDFSLAGRQLGGEEGSGTRSSLLWECRRCIEAKKPKFLLLENVTALVSKKFYPLFMKWVDTVASFNYENFWSTLNAKQYGVPQNRDRVFLVSIRKDNADEIINYNFPNPIESDCSIEDVLENTNNPQYYINQQKVDEWVKENEQRIIEYVAERNGLNPEDLSIDNSVSEQEDNEESPDNEENMNNTEQEEITVIHTDNENTVCECQEESETQSDNITSEEVNDSSSLKKKVSKKKKSQTRGGTLLKQIPTPTTSKGSAPTIMATGYGSADYKNFYSVGHFPKLGVLEVWTDGSDKVSEFSQNNKFNLLF